MADNITTDGTTSDDMSLPVATNSSFPVTLESSSHSKYEAKTVDGRSSTFSSQITIGISSTTLWRNKVASAEGIRSFETSRKAQIDLFQEKDRLYWQSFEQEILRAREENTRLQRFFTLRIQADLAYAESLKKIRFFIEQPSSTPLPSSTDETSVESMSIASTLIKAVNTMAQVQQHVSDKLIQFTTTIQRDISTRPLDEMITTYEERTQHLITEGNRLDASLVQAQRLVVDSFRKYDGLYRDMERLRQTNSEEHVERDLWLAEILYSIHVYQLQQTRIDYVKGMSTLFQQYKHLEKLRISVLQTCMDTYLRKQVLLYEELSGVMTEPLTAVQRIDPERDLMHSIRRIPKNYTAAALSSDSTDQHLFKTLRSPFISPLLVRCGYLKLQNHGSLLFTTWKDVMCAITQDHYLHVMELKEDSTRTIVESHEAMINAICIHEQTAEIVCISINLRSSSIQMIGNNTIPSFEIIEKMPTTGVFSSMFRMETSRKFIFQCISQSDLLDWVVATKRFIALRS